MNSIRQLVAVICFGMAVLPLAGQVRFDNDRHDFGSVIWKNPCHAIFKVVNDGEKPLGIKEVRTDCGCAVAEWPRQPIAPGATAEVAVTFDAELLGHFEKQVAVYTDVSDKVYYLTLRGNVVTELTGNAENFPYHVGEIFLDADNLEFDDVRRGDNPVKTIQIYNSGRQTFTPDLMHLPKYLTVTAEPEDVRPGRTARLRFVLDSEKLRAYGLTQTSIYLSRFPGDRVTPDNEIVVSATLLPDLDQSEAALSAAPCAQLDSMSIDFGSLDGKKKMKREVVLTNTGRSLLKVTALQVYNPGIGVSLGKRTLEPGQSTKLKITLNAASGTFKGRRRVLMITNDPVNPKIVIDVIAKK